MIDSLFVYGTLMRGARSALGRGERARLARESRTLGPATVNGVLFDLGGYPGLVLDSARFAVVHGELLRLHRATATFAWLDVYEGIGFGGPGGSSRRDEYARKVAPVHRADGHRVWAWAYVFQGQRRGLNPIPEGRWTSS